MTASLRDKGRHLVRALFVALLASALLSSFVPMGASMHRAVADSSPAPQGLQGAEWLAAEMATQRQIEPWMWEARSHRISGGASQSQVEELWYEPR